MQKLQILISNQYNPHLNRAVESYLTDHQAEGIVTMYLWKNQQTVVIGYNQNPYSECNVKLLFDEGGHLMRRERAEGPSITTWATSTSRSSPTRNCMMFESSSP